MTDPDVERELEANRRRDENRVAGDPGDAGPADDDAIFDPLTRVFTGPPDDDEEAEEGRREENDEEQRPDE